MARLLSRMPLLPIKSQLKISSPNQKLRRFLSHKPTAEIIEIDLGSSSFEGDAEEAVMMKKMEDMIQRLIVQRSTPDWLPFMPGSSFWVPPGNITRPTNLDDLFSKFRSAASASHLPMPLTDEQEIAFFTLRGWPCHHFHNDDHNDNNNNKLDAQFHQDSSSPPQDIEVTLEVKVCTASGNSSADDEDK